MTAITHPSGYRIGAPTATQDGAHGTVSALVVDPRTRMLTHLAVEPVHRHHQARLVPVAMASAGPDGDVRIACDERAFGRLDTLEELETIDIGSSETGAWGESINGIEYQSLWADRPPEGEEALRHGTPVRSGTVTIGHLSGLLVGADSRVNAVLVASGHLWSRQTVAVPVDAVTSVEADGLAITGTWDQLRQRG